MVKSQLPMWEKDVGIRRPSTARSEPTPRAQPRPSGDNTARSQPTQKVKGITPRKRRTKKLH